MRLLRQLQYWLRRGALTRELAEELVFHRETMEKDFIARGMGPAEARDAAGRAMGNETYMREEARAVWIAPWLESVWQDATYAVRGLRARPLFAAAAVLSLGVGIGANAVIFSIVNAYLYRNLAFAGSNRIVYLRGAVRLHPGRVEGLSYPTYTDIKEQANAFSEVAALMPDDMVIAGDSIGPARIYAVRMTANGLSVLGQSPAMGRGFVAGDALRGAPAVVIVSDNAWHQRYNADPAVVGRRVRLDGEVATIIGVMPPHMRFPTWTDAWVPLRPASPTDRSARDLLVFGRLARGAGTTQARTQLQSVADRASRTYASEADHSIILQSFEEFAWSDSLRSMLYAEWGAVAFVLLIACANVANLLLARGFARARELAMRSTLGAGRWRIVRQLLVESLILSLAGTVLGCGLGVVGLRLYGAVEPPPEWMGGLSIDGTVLLYLVVVGVVTGIGFGLLPALRASKHSASQTLKDGGRGISGAAHARLFGGLVVAEVALTVVLLAGSAIMIRSLLNASGPNLGIDVDQVMTAQVNLPENTPHDAGARAAADAADVEMARRLVGRVSEMPEVTAAAVASGLPLQRTMTVDYEVEGVGAAVGDGLLVPSVGGLSVTPLYFETLGIGRARAGRVFNENDRAESAPVALVNEAFVARHLAGTNPIGRHVRVVWDTVAGPWIQIVGVVGDVIQAPVGASGHEALVYRPIAQVPSSRPRILARTRGQPAQALRSFRGVVQEVAPTLPVENLLTLRQHVDERNDNRRLFSGLFAGFALIALVLAAGGLYAVVAQGVNRRTQELGVRLALGAPAASIVRLVSVNVLGQMALGLALGVAGAFAATRVLAGTPLLVGVSPADPQTLAASVVILLLAATAGVVVPIRRATHVDPALSLRAD
jgi:putative ABC transport system permease protein